MLGIQLESILHDQNEINEEVALQFELINQSIAELNARPSLEEKRPKIGFVTGSGERELRCSHQASLS